MKRIHIGGGIAGIAALIAGLIIALTGGGQPQLTVTFGGVHGTPQHEVTLNEHLVDIAKSTDLANHQHLRSENPVGVTPAQLDAADKQQEALAQSANLPNVTPDAAPQQRGCTTRLVQNYSSRRGVPPRVFVLHYTVSANRPGTGDVYAVASLFDRPAFSASSNYVIDNEGNCLYIVRESDKAWTQAAANPFSISAEVINTGHEATYAGTRGLAKLGSVISDSARRWNIPLQAGLVRGCVVVRPGIVDHHSLGACGGGHFDITPFSVGQVIAAAKKARGTPTPPPPNVTQACTVRNLQLALNSRLGLHLKVDGVYGTNTVKAIKTLQGRLGIPQTGNAGARVGTALHLLSCHIG